MHLPEENTELRVPAERVDSHGRVPHGVPCGVFHVVVVHVELALRTSWVGNELGGRTAVVIRVDHRRRAPSNVIGLAVEHGVCVARTAVLTLSAGSGTRAWAASDLSASSAFCAESESSCSSDEPNAVGEAQRAARWEEGSAVFQNATAPGTFVPRAEALAGRGDCRLRQVPRD